MEASLVKEVNFKEFIKMTKERQLFKSYELSETKYERENEYQHATRTISFRPSKLPQKEQNAFS